MKNKIEIFRNEFCLNKKDLQQDFSSFVKTNVIESDIAFTQTHQNSLLKLCDEFKKSLDSCNLPDLKDDWWYYDFYIGNDEIELNLLFCNVLELDETGEIIRTESTVEFTLLNTKSDYLTVDQFAKNHGVTNTTVRQWIRRGKLRTAKKMGRDWLIPSIAERPSRGFTSVRYRWIVLPQNISDQFPFLKGYKSIFVTQNEQNKSIFDCYLNDGNSGTHMMLSNIEREKLEVALIGNSTIEVY